MKKNSKDEFIFKSKEIHFDKYDYSLVNYNKSSEKVTIICKEHGEFIQRASNHLLGRGCYDCRKTRISNLKIFIEKSNIIHNNIYNYDNVIYNGAHKLVTIFCKIHGYFKQSPSNHLSGKGCIRCAKESGRLILDNFINRSNLIHNFGYDYNLVKYKNLRTKISIICREHGVFTQRAKNHIDGQGCPNCGDRFGIKENKWLDSLGIGSRQVRIGKYIVDGYDPVKNIVYEFNGDFWHGNPDIYNLNDINSVLNKTFGELYNKTMERENSLIKDGYNVISIWENDFNKLQIII